MIYNRGSQLPEPTGIFFYKTQDLFHQVFARRNTGPQPTKGCYVAVYVISNFGLKFSNKAHPCHDVESS